MKARIAETVGTLFYRNRHLLVLTIVVALVAGASAFMNLPRLEDPRITHRNPLIVTPVPGASAERVEALVTEKLEQELRQVDEIKDLESTSRAGVSVIAIELADEVDDKTNREVFSEIRDKIADAVPRLPPEAAPPIFDDQRDPSAFTLIMGVVDGSDPRAGDSHDDTARLGILHRVGEDLADRLRNVPGTELVRVYGTPEEEITVTVEPAELAALGLTAADVATRVARSDSKVPAGVARGRSDVLVEVAGELDSLARVAAVPLRHDAAGTVVRVGDVAEVRREWRTPPAEVGRVDGRRAVLVAARMQPEQRIDRWSTAAIDEVDRFGSMLGDGIALDIVFDQSRYTNARLVELGSNLLAGALVVMVVVFLMMGWRSALVVGSALPLTVALALFGLMLSGNALHQMSVYGMIVALGLLIDNAIVATDEVRKYRAAGKSPREAVAATVGHLFLPLAASTATTVLAFAPILLLPGSVGDFVGSIGSSVILAMVASFVLGMTVIVSLAACFAGGEQTLSRPVWWRDGISSARLTALYRKTISAGLRRPAIAILVAVSLPVAGFLVARFLGNEFFPPVDRDMFHVQMWLPGDSSIDHTDERARAVEAAMREYPEIEHVYWLVGGSFPTVYYNLVMNRDDSPHYAQAVVVTRTSREAKRAIPEIQRDLDERFPGAQLVVRQFGQGPPVLADIQYRLYGPSLERLHELGEAVRVALQGHPDVLHTRATLARGEPKLWLRADEDEVRNAGLTLADVARQMQSGLEGRVGGSVVEQLEEMPVRIRFGEEHRRSVARIGSTRIVAPASDEWIPLAAIGELELEPQLGEISRFDGLRTNVVEAYTRNGALPIDVTHAVLDRLERAGFALPVGYRLELGGAVEQDAEAMGNLATYAPVLATLMVGILILTFRSVRIAAMLGVIAVLSVGLALLSTWLIRFPVSFNTILGTLGLMGVAFNDSIVVLAAIRANARARAGDRAEIVEEVLGTTRHIVSTTLTTIGGFLPLLLFVGGDFWPGLAIVLAGGVGGATILALGFVPAAYVVLHRGARPVERASGARQKVEDRAFGSAAPAAVVEGGAV